MFIFTLATWGLCYMAYVNRENCVSRYTCTYYIYMYIYMYLHIHIHVCMYMYVSADGNQCVVHCCTFFDSCRPEGTERGVWSLTGMAAGG